MEFVMGRYAEVFQRSLADPAAFWGVASLRRVDVITALPKTRSGKILRKTMRGIADGRDEPAPSTIEDPAVLDTLRAVLTDPG
jgi:propionyl-CoA synthetase